MSEDDVLGPVGFTAAANTTRQYLTYQPLLFQDVRTNIGGAYDDSSSVFTCPVTGVYVISVSVTSSINQTITGRIRIEKQTYVLASGDIDPVSQNSGSAMVVEYCIQGENIWIESGTNEFHETHGNSPSRSSFSAFLLYPL